MRKENPETAALKNTLVKSAFLPLLLVLVALMKVGQVPKALLNSLVRLLKAFLLIRYYLALPRLNLPFIHKGRGRPRLKPFFPFYFERVKKTGNRLVPRFVRVRIALVLIFALLFFYSFSLVKISSQLPSPERLTSSGHPLTTEIYDRQGRLLYQLYEGRNRKLVKLEELPPYVIYSTVAIEDKHFFTHPGIDFLGIIRAIKANLDGANYQGGSTITQQLIKNTLLTSDQTLKRKIKEMVLSFWAERIFSKKEILRMYFNEVPYGGPAWGIEAASEMYFGKTTSNLTLAESAFLAGLPAAPSQYSPYGAHPEKGRKRQAEVLRRMVEDGYISQKEADEALSEELAFRGTKSTIKAPHFVMYVRSALASKFGERVVSQGGLKVVTTLDLDIQQRAENIVSEQISKLTNLRVTNGAAMVMDPKNGQILAMVGSKDYFDPQGGNFNVTLSLRQPGSSFKPITYTQAFKEGFTPGSILLDTPTTFGSGGQSYSPVNYDGKFHGPITIRTALASSYNIPAVKMLATLGLNSVIQTAKDLGLTTLDDPSSYGLSLTLGGAGVRMIDMMTVYSTFASGGVRHSPQLLLSVTDPYGNVLEDNSTTSEKRVLSPQIAYLISNILSDNKARVPAFGEHSALEIAGHTVAVKTGTSDNKVDNWTFGYTPEFVVGSWVGNNDNSMMDPKLTSGVTGAAPIWHDIMVSLISGRPNLAFERPSGVIEVETGGQKELGLSGQTSKNIVLAKKTKEKDESTGQEKEVITYSDPFSSNIVKPSKTTQ